MTPDQQSTMIGIWLFRRRSWLPLLFYPAAIISLLVSRPFSIILWSPIFDILCLLFSCAGIAIRTHTIGYTKLGETLPSSGMYSINRYPLHMGNILIWLGLIVYVGVPWFMVGAALTYIIYTLKLIITDGRILEQKFGIHYIDWCNREIKKWIKPEVKFALLNTLRGEYTDITRTMFSFIAISLLKTRVTEFTWELSTIWIYIGIATTIFALICKVTFKYYGIQHLSHLQKHQ